MPLPLPSQTPVAYTEYEDNSQHHTGRYNYGGSSSHTIPASEQLSAFEQTLKEDDERFYRQFPAARGAADNPWTMVDNSPLGGYAFSYHGSSGTGKSWKDCASAESSSSWSQVSPQQLVIDATAPEAAAVEHESPSFTHHHPSYALSGALVPSPPLHYDYTGHVRFDSSSPPETVISAQEGPSSPVYASYSEPVHSSLHASPVLQEAPFYNTFPTHPQPTYDYDAYYPPPTSYGRKIKEEPIMDYLEPPSSPTPDLATSTPSPSETSSHILYPLSQASSPGLYSSSTGEMVPLTRKARGHAMPIPNNPNARSFYYKLARPGTSHATQHPPMVTSYSRRTPVPVNASKAADKKPPLACFFCRQRKIACSAPAPESHDKTCNQCSRRKLICEYPKESRRGMRKNSKKNTTGDTPAPPLQQPNTKGT